MTLPAKIDSATKTAELETCRAFLLDPALDRLPLAVLLAESITELLRLRAQLGQGFAAQAGYRRITLCGSRRFDRAFQEWSRRLQLEQSAMVYAAQVIPNLTPDQKRTIDLLWFAQIEASDEIFVLDVGGYVGESTAEEIAFARERGIRVRLLSQEAPGWTEADCRFLPSESAGGNDLNELIEKAKQRVASMTPAERAAHFEAQRKAWVAAEMSFGDEGTRAVPAAAPAFGEG